MKQILLSAMLVNALQGLLLEDASGPSTLEIAVMSTGTVISSLPKGRPPEQPGKPTTTGVGNELAI